MALIEVAEGKCRGRLGVIGGLRCDEWNRYNGVIDCIVIGEQEEYAISSADYGITLVLLDRFHITAGTYCQIIFAFMLASTIMNGVSGPLLDRLGSRLGYSLTIAFWSAAEVLAAASTGALTLGAYRFLLGMGEVGTTLPE